MYVTTCVTCKPEVGIDLLTFTEGQCKLSIFLCGNCTDGHARFRKIRESLCLSNFNPFPRGHLCLE